MEKKSLGDWLIIAGIGTVFSCLLLSMVLIAIMSLISGDPMGAIIGLGIIGLTFVFLGICLNDD